IAIPLSDRRPHWTHDKEIAYVRAGAHSLPMRPQTLLDLASRGQAVQTEIDDFKVLATPKIDGTKYTFFVCPMVRLVGGPSCEHWSFSLSVVSGYVTIQVPGNLPDGCYSEPRHLSVRGRDILFVDRSTPVLGPSLGAINLIWDQPKEEDEIEAVLYA